MSPAPGREGRDQGKRMRSNSGSGSDSDVELGARKGRSRSVMAKACNVDASNHEPVGQVVEQAVSPALQDPDSPAPVRKVSELQNESLSSPVFKRIQATNLRMNPLI